MSKIVRLEAEAFKRLRAVEIRPDGTVVQIRGLNGEGKSSVLDAIAAALGGEKLCPEVPIHRGAKKARVEVELDDGLVVERRWTASGTRLEVRSKEGATFKSPQAILDGLVGKLTFDPLAFLREKPERQSEVLRQLVGVDFTPLERARAAAFARRTEVNRAVAAAKARLASMPPADDAPDAPVSTADLLAEQQRRSDLATANARRRGELQRVRDEYTRAGAAVTTAERRVKEAEETLRRAQEEHEAAVRAQEDVAARGAALRAEVEKLTDPDLQEIPKQLLALDQTNERVRQKKARAELAQELASAEAQAEKLTAEIEEVDATKAAALAKASFPVEGLGFGEHGVTLNGLPLEQASGAEQLRVSVAMGLALNPKLKVLLVRDASLLDERSLAMVADMATKAGAQVWLEVVSAGGAGIVIEDGAVAGAEPAAEVGT